ncbi:MAG: hypothetical protein KC621_17220, partial [Myxococcales bacterium]|nr:hypothetical protein [Myxococcales bacterium]
MRLRDRAYVLSANDIHGVVLWSTDGVSVERVVSWPPNSSRNASHGPLSVVDDRLWFSVVADGVEAVVMSDGTTEGTDAVLPLVDLLSVSRVAPLDGRALLVADGRLHTIDPITGDRHTLGPDRFVGDPIALPAGGHAWAVRNTGRQREYWRTDGTEAGTELVFTTNIPLHRDDRAPAGIGAVLFAVDGDGNEVAWSEAGGQHTFGKCDVAGSVRSARLCVTRSEGQATLLALDGTTGVSRTIGSHSTSPNAPPLIFPDDDGGAIVVWPSTGSALVERIDAHGDTLGAAPAFLGRAPAPLTRYELHGGLDDEKIVLSRGEATAVVDVATGTEAFTEVKGDVIAADHHGYFSLHTSERESALRRYEVGSSEARVLASWDAPLSREWRRVGDAIALQVGIGPGADWWISDGTPEGTRLLVDVPTNANVVDLLAIEGGDMEALAVIDGQRMELWTLTPTGFEVTRRILGERLTEPRLLARGEHRFIAHMALGRSDYWRLRITELVADVDQPQLRYESAPTLDLARYVDGRFVLIGGDALVLTDDGVERIEASGVRDLVPFEGGAILSAEWPGLGVELLRWRDGAVELLRDLAPGPASSAPG